MSSSNPVFASRTPGVGATYVPMTPSQQTMFIPPKGPYTTGQVVPESGGAKKNTKQSKKTKQTKAKPKPAAKQAKPKNK